MFIVVAWFWKVSHSFLFIADSWIGNAFTRLKLLSSFSLTQLNLCKFHSDFVQVQWTEPLKSNVYQYKIRSKQQQQTETNKQINKQKRSKKQIAKLMMQYDYFGRKFFKIKRKSTSNIDKLQKKEKNRDIVGEYPHAGI